MHCRPTRSPTHTNFVDGVGDNRYDREHYWSFCDYETVFASDKVFDPSSYGGAKGEVVELPIGRVRLTNATLLWQLRIEVFLVREEIVCRYD